MLKKYKIILLKNSVPKKTLFSSNVKRTTQHKFHKFINGKKPLFHKEYVKRKYCQFELGIFLNDVALNNKKPLFIRKYVKRKFCQFELALFSKEVTGYQAYRKDELGRNVEVSIPLENYHLMDLVPYWVEELVYDHHKYYKKYFY